MTKITAHKDGTLSIRLPRHSAQGRGAGADDLTHAIAQAELSMEGFALKDPSFAKEATMVAERYRALRYAIEEVLNR